MYDERNDEFYIPYDELVEAIAELFSQFQKHYGTVNAVGYLLEEYDYQIKSIQENNWLVKVLLFERGLMNEYLIKSLEKEVIDILNNEWLQKLWNRQNWDADELTKRENHLKKIYNLYLLKK